MAAPPCSLRPRLESAWKINHHGNTVLHQRLYISRNDLPHLQNDIPVDGRANNSGRLLIGFPHFQQVGFHLLDRVPLDGARAPDAHGGLAVREEHRHEREAPDSREDELLHYATSCLLTHDSISIRLCGYLISTFMIAPTYRLRRAALSPSITTGHTDVPLEAILAPEGGALEDTHGDSRTDLGRTNTGMQDADCKTGP